MSARTFGWLTIGIGVALIGAAGLRWISVAYVVTAALLIAVVILMRIAARTLSQEPNPYVYPGSLEGRHREASILDGARAEVHAVRATGPPLKPPGNLLFRLRGADGALHAAPADAPAKWCARHITYEVDVSIHPTLRTFKATSRSMATWAAHHLMLVDSITPPSIGLAFPEPPQASWVEGFCELNGRGEWGPWKRAGQAGPVARVRLKAVLPLDHPRRMAFWYFGAVFGEIEFA